MEIHRLKPGERKPTLEKFLEVCNTGFSRTCRERLFCDCDYMEFCDALDSARKKVRLTLQEPFSRGSCYHVQRAYSWCTSTAFWRVYVTPLPPYRVVADYGRARISGGEDLIPSIDQWSRHWHQVREHEVRRAETLDAEVLTLTESVETPEKSAALCAEALSVTKRQIHKMGEDLSQVSSQVLFCLASRLENLRVAILEQDHRRVATLVRSLRRSSVPTKRKASHKKFKLIDIDIEIEK